MLSGAAAASPPPRRQQDAEAQSINMAEAAMLRAMLSGASCPPPLPALGQAPPFVPWSGEQADRDRISQVSSSLFITNWRGVERADELQELGIRHIICVNEQENKWPQLFNYFSVHELEDQEDHDATPYFERVSDFCAPILERSEAICFHCAAGISRSSTMLLAVLMRLQRLSLRAAFALVHSKRPVVWPNRSFMRQLIAYEVSLQQKGILAGTGGTIGVEEWDAWTQGAGLEVNHQFAAVNVNEREASLKGNASLQFQEYKKSMQAKQ